MNWGFSIPEKKGYIGRIGIAFHWDGILVDWSKRSLSGSPHCSRYLRSRTGKYLFSHGRKPFPSTRKWVNWEEHKIAPWQSKFFMNRARSGFIKNWHIHYQQYHLSFRLAHNPPLPAHLRHLGLSRNAFGGAYGGMKGGKTGQIIRRLALRCDTE